MRSPWEGRTISTCALAVCHRALTSCRDSDSGASAFVHVKPFPYSYFPLLDKLRTMKLSFFCPLTSIKVFRVDSNICS